MVFLELIADIYIVAVSAVHCVCKKGAYIAIISTVVESSEPEKELEVALKLLGGVKEKFTRITDRYEPVKHCNDGIFICSSLDATSHFENEAEKVFRLYKEITGCELDLNKLPEDVEE
jgi:Rab GDP dissociation inhibitor